MSIRLILADDHLLLRDGLRLLFEKHGLNLLGEADNGAEAVELARKLRPDVAILDLSMPVMNGIEAAAEIQRELGIPCILVTMHMEEQYVVRAFSEGISGYVLKSRASQDLVEAVREVAAGNVYLSPGISKIVVHEIQSRESASRQEVLSLRERQVLQLIAEGHTTKEVAQHLGISTRTGESHRSRIMEKLGIHETAGLVRFAIRNGMIEP